MNLSNDSVDPTVLSNLREIMQEDGDDAPFLEILELFTNDSPTHLRNIHLAVANSDGNQLKRAAHSLKGSCSNIGALQMVQLCLKLEQIGSSGTVVGAEPLLPSLEAEFARVKTVLDDVNQALSPS